MFALIWARIIGKFTITLFKLTVFKFNTTNAWVIFLFNTYTQRVKLIDDYVLRTFLIQTPLMTYTPVLPVMFQKGDNE